MWLGSLTGACMAVGADRSSVHGADRFASLNEALDADLEVLRKPPEGLALQSTASLANGSSPPTPAQHPLYGSPG